MCACAKKLQPHSIGKLNFRRIFPVFPISLISCFSCWFKLSPQKLWFKLERSLLKYIVKQAMWTIGIMGKIHCLALIHFDSRFYKFTSFLLGFCFGCFVWFTNSWNPSKYVNFVKMESLNIPGGAFAIYTFNECWIKVFVAGSLHNLFMWSINIMHISIKLQELHP